jgi:hypothetical protein
LKDDMFAAQFNQNEASAQKLRNSIAVVNGNIATLRGLPSAPAELAGFESSLASALDEAARGTAALTRAVDNEDQAAGLEAFTALNNAESMLGSAESQL